MKKKMLLILVGIIIGLALQAEAALEPRGTDNLGNQLIYDTDLDITWYDYTQSAADWNTQNSWASNLMIDYGGSIFDDWRLPTAVNDTYIWGYDGTTTAGWNITSSEMGHLFYTELGNDAYCSVSADCPQAGWGLTNTEGFQNLQAKFYWTGTAANNEEAWNFYMNYGSQDLLAKSYNGYAMAVREGDVANMPVAPEPVSTVLFLTGGAAMGLRRLRMKKKVCRLTVSG